MICCNVIQENLVFVVIESTFPSHHCMFYCSHQNSHKNNVIFSWNRCFCFLPYSSTILNPSIHWSVAVVFKYFQFAIKKKIDFQLDSFQSLFFFHVLTVLCLYGYTSSAEPSLLLMLSICNDE